jgi:hypothetical protein
LKTLKNKQFAKYIAEAPFGLPACTHPPNSQGHWKLFYEEVLTSDYDSEV